MLGVLGRAAAGSVASGNQYPKVSNGATYCLNQFQFKNKEDMMAFANSYLDGCQGNMVAGGCTQHAFAYQKTAVLRPR